MIQPNCLESDSVASGPQWKVASANKAAPRYDLPGYAELLSDLKSRIARARIAARTAVNREIIFLYWQIGQEILARQKELGWGAKVIDRLSADLRHAFPEGSGFSSRNLKYMRRLAAAYEQEELVQQVVAQIPWGHHTVLLDRVASPAERRWYTGQIIEHGWSRAVLRHHNNAREARGFSPGRDSASAGRRSRGLPSTAKFNRLRPCRTKPEATNTPPTECGPSQARPRRETSGSWPDA